MDPETAGSIGDWFQVIIIAIFTSGIASATVTFFLNVRYERKKLYRQKLEELYLDASTWINSMRKHLHYHQGVVEGSYDLKHANERAKVTPEIEAAQERVILLTSVYFPRLAGPTQAMGNCVGKFVEQSKDYLQKYVASHQAGKEPPEDLAPRMLAMRDELEATGL